METEAKLELLLSVLRHLLSALITHSATESSHVTKDLQWREEEKKRGKANETMGPSTLYSNTND
jgi:hypothetical protein